ncbi:MAG: BREX system Lon protease-like protein BrxL [Chloroflexota bacterium]|nr:MAG: BREX system Lon protease-like protein BrxL [Chloroflexota bacterium]
MNYLDQKINQHFEGLVVRKDLVKTVKGNAIVPTYVLEYLLGQYCATSDEDSILSGIETVKDILRKHYVHRSEANLIKSTIRERGRHRVIDKVSVVLNTKTDSYEATFSNLGIDKVVIDTDTIKRHPKLLVSGVWCISDIEYMYTDEVNKVPWILDSIKPIQLSHFDFDLYLEKRKQFTLEEWIDLLIQSIGFNPDFFDLREKLFQLMRLVPYCERNYNMIELGPKGTGKSHIYSDFSPHGILISGGEVTVPKLFVDNRTGKIGLVGFWDAVAFDEFAGKKKRSNKSLVDILKNYMANKSFSRGIETIGAGASLVFIGNTSQKLSHLLMHSNLFEDLSPQFYDSAFLDRLHFYIPGWEVDIIRGEMFSGGYGFVVDYLAEILRYLRDYDYTHKYTEHFELSSALSTRDRDGINKTFSGLMKILFPDGSASKEDMEMILEFAAEGRKRVKDQLMRIDSTYSMVEFSYVSLADGVEHSLKTLEETTFPRHYYQQAKSNGTDDAESALLDKNRRSTRKETEVEELIDKGESDQVEFKSTLRWNLHAKRIDKGVEHSALKTIVAFLNKEGGTLLVGIGDDGNVLGIEPDRFPNEDKYLLHFSNLVNDKIGKQHSDYIRWGLREIQDKFILRVDCAPSPNPVFLKAKDGEEFYIRTGPSSVQLSAREVLEYSKKHFR